MRCCSPTPACKGVHTWIKANGLSLAPLTGTDTKALSAAVHIIELYAYSADDAVLAAFRAVVECMQPTTQEYAYHAIAHVMDWNDRDRLWDRAGLPFLERVRRCKGER